MIKYPPAYVNAYAQELSNLLDTYVGSGNIRYAAGKITGTIGSISIDNYPELIEYLPALLEYVSILEGGYSEDE